MVNTGTFYLGTLDHIFKDTEIGDIAKTYNIPDWKAYIAVVCPISEEPFIQAGGAHLVLGMEYGAHNWGFQMSIGGIAIKHRHLYIGVWQEWKTVTMS